MGRKFCRVMVVVGAVVAVAWATPAVSGTGDLEGKFLCRAESFTYLDNQHRKHDEMDLLRVGSKPFLIWVKEGAIFQSVGSGWKRIFSITQSSRAGKPTIVGLDSKADSLDWFRLTQIQADEFRYANGFVGADWAESRPVTLIAGTCQRPD